ncbi:hypothetical protein QBC34DRAFT_395549 [Podospora aff. communis PSN243]|uniref:Uncharacterized protein n=1 Tax=Podospora aff. communis PSN243 TaxID=3040156 RepID=A0AAV9H0B1_9PEZI|nr:hypothetical protein QBC34DRAFT_395549 [Podospora aff. communis PSN243]
MQAEALAAGPMALRQMSGIGPKKKAQIAPIDDEASFAVSETSNIAVFEIKYHEVQKTMATVGRNTKGLRPSPNQRRGQRVWISSPFSPRRRGQRRLDSVSRITAARASQGRVHCTKELTSQTDKQTGRSREDAVCSLLLFLAARLPQRTEWPQYQASRPIHHPRRSPLFWCPWSPAGKRGLSGGADMMLAGVDVFRITHHGAAGDGPASARFRCDTQEPLPSVRKHCSMN